MIKLPQGLVFLVRGFDKSNPGPGIFFACPAIYFTEEKALEFCNKYNTETTHFWVTALSVGGMDWKKD